MNLKYWKDRKFELTDKTISEIVDKVYHNSYPNTKTYIKSLIKLFGRNQNIRKFSTMIVKEDLIEQYLLGRSKKFLPNVDFSKVPDIIGGITEKFCIIYRDKIGGIEIGEYYTTFKELIICGIDIFPINDYANYTKSNINKIKTDYLINKLSSKYDTSDIIACENNAPVKVTCRVCGRTYWEFTNILENSECKYCRNIRMDKSLSFKDFVDKANIIHNNKYDYSKAKETFKMMSSPKILIKCKICGTEFYQTPKEHLVSEYSCPNCRSQHFSEIRKYNEEDLRTKLSSISGPNYSFDNSKIGRVDDPIEIIDLTTGELFYRKPVDILRGYPIKSGHISFGEDIIDSWLRSKNIQFIHGKKVLNKIMGRSKKEVIIDFEILINNCIYWIESNGKQHYFEEVHNSLQYKSAGRYRKSKNCYTFQQQLDRDKNVKEYCKQNNIVFIEIPYTYYSYSKIDQILTAILLEGKNPEDIIEIPPIKYIT